MTKYRLSNVVKDDLIRIHQYGVKNFGVKQADSYFEAFFICFDLISDRPFAFESDDYIKQGYKRCICDVDTIYFRINENIIEIMTIIGRQETNNLP